MAKDIRTLGTFIAAARQTVSFLRLKPFETSTSEGRSNERHRRAALTAVASAFARGITVLTMLITVPLTINYLGAERYGLWMTISSVIAMLGFADLGIGNGLLNRISEAHGRNDPVAARKFVSSAFYMLLGLSLLLAAILWAVYPSLNWAKVFNVSSSEAIAESGQAVVVFAICFFINLPLGVVTRIQAGYQRGFINSFWLAGGNVLGLIGVLVAIKLQAGLPWLVLAMVGSPVLASFFNAIVLFVFQKRYLIPKWSEANLQTSGALFRLGSSFFVLQICYALSFTSDYLILAHLLGQDAVAEYSVVARLFAIIPMLTEMVFAPLWPTYAEALVRGDVNWVKKTLRTTALYGGLLSIVAATFLVLGGKVILHVWVGPEVDTTFFLLLGFGIWTVCSVVGSSVAMFLNGSGKLGFQVACSLGLAVAAPIVKILFATQFGVSGIVWGTVLTYLFCIALPMSIYVPFLLKNLEEQVKPKKSLSLLK